MGAKISLYNVKHTNIRIIIVVVLIARRVGLSDTTTHSSVHILQ